MACADSEFWELVVLVLLLATDAFILFLTFLS